MVLQLPHMRFILSFYWGGTRWSELILDTPKLRLRTKLDTTFKSYDAHKMTRGRTDMTKSTTNKLKLPAGFAGSKFVSVYSSICISNCAIIIQTVDSL